MRDRLLYGEGVPWYLLPFLNLVAVALAVPVAVVWTVVSFGFAFLLGVGLWTLIQWLAGM